MGRTVSPAFFLVVSISSCSCFRALSKDCCRRSLSSSAVPSAQKESHICPGVAFGTCTSMHPLATWTTAREWTTKSARSSDIRYGDAFSDRCRSETGSSSSRRSAIGERPQVRNVRPTSHLLGQTSGRARQLNPDRYGRRVLSPLVPGRDRHGAADASRRSITTKAALVGLGGRPRLRPDYDAAREPGHAGLVRDRTGPTVAASGVLRRR